MSKFLWDIQSVFYRNFRRNPISARILREENEAVKSLLESYPVKSIKYGLDIGAGTGNSLALFPKYDANWIALDLSLSMINKSRSKFKKVRFIAGDAKRLPFKPESYDLILCIGISEYLKKLDDFLREIWKVLKPDGIVILTLTPPVIFNFFRRLIGHRIYPRTPLDLIKSLDQVPFKILQKSCTRLQDQYLLQKR